MQPEVIFPPTLPRLAQPSLSTIAPRPPRPLSAADWSDEVGGRRSGFDVSRAFAVGVGGAAPELGGCLAGGAAAHGFVTDGAQGDSCLFSSGLDSGGVETLGEAAVFFRAF